MYERHQEPLISREVYLRLMFIVVAGLLFAPVIHRFLHIFHMEAGRKGRDD